MKRILLVRHANASHQSDGGDFDRQLNEKGLAEAKKMALKVIMAEIIPQYLISSSAARAKATAQIFAENFGLQIGETNRVIYEGNEDNLLKVINNFPDEHNYIALFGHNPDVSNLLLKLTGEYRNVPTCAVCLIVFEEANHWAEVTADSGRLQWYGAPHN